MKPLERATSDYEKAKKRVEMLKGKLQEATYKLKECEAAKTEAENLEYVRIIREVHLSVSDLVALTKQLKHGLPEMTDRKEKTVNDEKPKNDAIM